MSNPLYDQIAAWVNRNNVRFEDGEWYKGKSIKALSTDKLIELLPSAIKDANAPLDIKEQLSALAEYLKSNNDDSDNNVIDFDEIAKIGVSQSIYSVGEKSINIELRGFPNVPNEIDISMMKNIVYAFDSNGRLVFFFTHKHESGCTEYTMIDSKDLDLDVESALMKSKMYVKVQTWWENQLLEWERNIVSIWNCNVRNPYAKVQEYILEKMPVTLITTCKFTIIGNEKETGLAINGNPEMILIARGVKFEVPLRGRVQYSNFIENCVAAYKSAAVREIPQVPKIYGNAGEDAMSIFDIAKYTAGEAPLSPYWLEVKSKFTPDEWEVLCAWVCGMLDGKNTGRQALALIDYTGYSGKSVLSDVLTKLLSLTNVGAIGKGSLSDKFWASKVWNKRLVIVDDNKNNRLLQTEAIHCVLGGGYADVEYKGEASFTWKMSSKLLINSNIDLEINSTMLHERSRVIILNPKMPAKLLDTMSAKDENGNVILDQNGNRKLLGDPNFVDNLYATIDGFLHEAMKHYIRLCPNRAEIIIPDSVLEKVYETESTEETMYNSILNKAFELTGDNQDTITRSEFMEQYMTITRNVKIYNEHSNNQDFSNFKQFVKKVHNIASSGRNRLFAGIKIRKYEELDYQQNLKATTVKAGFRR